MSQKVLIIGICGVTCGGKTTIANKLNNILPSSTIICQDDYFLDVGDPRHKWIESLDHINFDILTSLDMQKMHSDVLKFIGNKTLITSKKINEKNLKIPLNDNLKKAVIDKIRDENILVLIVEGFSTFNYKPMRDLFSLKYYFMLSKEECFRRRKLRVYDPPDCPGYFEVCAWPEHLSQLEEVKREFDDITYFDEHTDNILEQILQGILNQF